MSRQALQKKAEAKGIHWIQAVGWGVFLSVVMFGFGFLAGTRFGERKAVDRVSDTVVRPIPLRLESSRHPEEESGFAVDDSTEVWGFLEDLEETPFPNEMTAARASEEDHVSPTEGNVDSPQESSVESVNGEMGTYSVQVGAFKDEKRAEALQQDLRKKGYASPRMLQIETQNAGTLYRVWVGRLQSKVDAESLAKRIREQEGHETLVVRERP